VLWWPLLSKKLSSRVKVSQLGIYRCVSGPNESSRAELSALSLSLADFFSSFWILRLTRWDSGLVKVTKAPWSRLFTVAPAFFKMVVQQRALAQVRPRVGARGSATSRIDFRMIGVACVCATYAFIAWCIAFNRRCQFCLRENADNIAFIYAINLDNACISSKIYIVQTISSLITLRQLLVIV